MRSAARADTHLVVSNGRGRIDFEDVYRVFAPRVARLVRSYTHDGVRAEDLLQETFLRVHRAWPTLDLTKPLWPLLQKIAKRLCIDEWKTSTHSGRSPVPEPLSDSQLVSAEPDPAEAFIADLRRRTVNETLDALDPKYQRILLLKDADGLRYEEIAQLEGTTLAGLRCSLARARKRFREQYTLAAQERGLSAATWPVMRLAVTALRTLKRRGIQLTDYARRAAVDARIEVLSPASALQLSNGIVALTVLIGTIVSPAGHAAGKDHGALPSRGIVLAAAKSPNASAPLVPYAMPRVAPPLGSDVAPGAPDAGDESPIHLGNVSPGPTQPVEPPAQVNNVTEPNQNVQGPEDAQVTSFAFSPSGDGTIFAAGLNRGCALTPTACPAVLFKSADGGATWTRLPAQGFDGRDLLLPPAFSTTDARIFAMSFSGVLQVSADGGQTFGPAVSGAPQFDGSVDISPGFDSGDPRILIGTQTDLFQYRDDTKTISPAPYSPAPGSLEPRFASPDLIIVGGRIPDKSRRLGSSVFRCENAVCTGSRFSNNQNTPKIRLLSDFTSTGHLFAFTPGELFSSADGGSTFTKITTPWQDGVLFDLAVGGTGQDLFAGVWGVAGDQSTGGLYVSRDGGAAWDRAPDSLFNSGAKVIQAAGQRLVVALGDGGVACSADLGATWASRC